MVVDEGPVDKSAPPRGRNRALPFPRDAPRWGGLDQDPELVKRRWDVNWRMRDSSAIEDIGAAVELTISNDRELAHFLQSAGQTHNYLRLRRLTVKGCTVDMGALFAAALYVQALALDNCSGIAVTRPFWDKLRSLTIIAPPFDRLDMTALLLGQAWPALTKLVVQNVELDLDALRRSVPLLKHLTVRRSNIMAGFSGSMAHLITLRLDDCFGIRSEMITQNDWPALTRLELAGCRFDLEAIREKTPQLRSLSLDHCDGFQTFRRPWARLRALSVRQPRGGPWVNAFFDRECVWPALETLALTRVHLDLPLLNTATPRLKDLTMTDTTMFDRFSQPMASLVTLQIKGHSRFRLEKMTQGVWPSLQTLSLQIRGDGDDIPPTLLLPNAPALKALDMTVGGIEGRLLSIDISLVERLESLDVTCPHRLERLTLLCERGGEARTYSRLETLAIQCKGAVLSLEEARMPRLKTATIKCRILDDYQALRTSAESLQALSLDCCAAGQLPRDIQPVTDLTLRPLIHAGDDESGSLSHVKCITVHLVRGISLDLRQLAGVSKITVLGHGDNVSHLGALIGTETIQLKNVAVVGQSIGAGPKFMSLSDVRVEDGQLQLSALEEAVVLGRMDAVLDLRKCPALRRLDLPTPAPMGNMWDTIKHVPEIHYAGLYYRNSQVVGAGLPPNTTWNHQNMS